MGQKGIVPETENKLGHQNLELHACGGNQWEKNEGWPMGITRSAHWPLPTTCVPTDISLLSQFWIP